MRGGSVISSHSPPEAYVPTLGMFVREGPTHSATGNPSAGPLKFSSMVLYRRFQLRYLGIEQGVCQEIQNRFFCSNFRLLDENQRVGAFRKGLWNLSHPKNGCPMEHVTGAHQLRIHERGASAIPPSREHPQPAPSGNGNRQELSLDCGG